MAHGQAFGIRLGMVQTRQSNAGSGLMSDEQLGRIERRLELLEKLIGEMTIQLAYLNEFIKAVMIGEGRGAE
jgi:hypothetical protein